MSMKKLAIAFWKWRLKVNYIRWADTLENMDCGMRVAYAVSPSLYKYHRRVNACSKRLQALGERAPMLAEPRE